MERKRRQLRRDSNMQCNREKRWECGLCLTNRLTILRPLNCFPERSLRTEFLDEKEGGVVRRLIYPSVGVDDVWVRREKEGVVVFSDEVNLKGSSRRFSQNRPDVYGIWIFKKSLRLNYKVAPLTFFYYSDGLTIFCVDQASTSKNEEKTWHWVRYSERCFTMCNNRLETSQVCFIDDSRALT